MSKTLKNELVKLLVDESKTAYECGQSNVPAPITEEEAARLVEAILKEYFGE